MNTKEFVKTIKWFLKVGTQKYKKSHDPALINEGLYRFDEMISYYNTEHQSQPLPHLKNLHIFPIDEANYSLKDFRRIGKHVLKQVPYVKYGKAVYQSY